MEKTPFIWLDGKLVEWDRAQVHVLTHSLHYGMAVFEGIRAYKTPSATAVFRLQEHVRRLFDSAHILGMKIPYTREQISEACRETVRANKMDEAYIRPLVFIGDGAMGVYAPSNPIRTTIVCWKWGAYLGEEGLKRGIRAKVSSFTRSHPNATMNKAKATANYVNSMLAKREARECGYDEAILLDPTGMVAEGSGENLFMVRDGVLTTPPLPNVLGGITRDTVLQIAADLKVPTAVRNFARDELYIADEAFFCGTAAEITPIREVDGRQVGEGKMGAVTQKIQESYFELVRGKGTNAERNARWLTNV
ncbi:MAG TPA: branched-chain amino acid transaminase [bacterium]|nr:branched-chain amino acid transaminase [bacterium]